MALISPQDVTRFPIPHEPGQWVELRPLTGRHFASIQRNAKEESPGEITLRLIAACLVAWSYDAEITPENIEALDYETFNWLDNQLSAASSQRTLEEKKDLEPPSSPTSVPAPEPSPPNSDTSARSPGLVSSIS